MIKDLIALSPNSRVWIYASDKELSYKELDEIRPEILNFLDGWTSHNNELVSYGNVFHKRFLALFVDETAAGASGCSIDKSVHFVEYLSKKYNKDFFDRQNVYFLSEEETVIPYSLNEIPGQYKMGKINPESLFFDNLVNTKESFLREWIKPVKDGWVNRFI